MKFAGSILRIAPRLAPGVVLILIVATVIGCNREPGPSKTTNTAGVAKVDACKLVSASEAQSVLGSPVTLHPIDTSVAGPNAASMCRYSTGHAQGGFMLLAGHLDYANAGSEIASRKLQAAISFKTNLGRSPQIADVKGLGEAAFLLEEPGFLQVQVLTHKTVLVITMTALPTTENVGHAERLAAIAVEHIQP